MKYLELLAPAKNADQGMAAICHGADAVYIGAPAFGARLSAGNSLKDIERLVSYAHLYGSKVFVTVNTLLFDTEIEAANQLIHQLYLIGADAIILQDLGLLETELPPIALHASTQTHNIDPRRVRFLEEVGFRRVILARETSLQQMKEIRKSSHVELEAFIHGALCVSYSGQCYLSQYLDSRSGNRGCCCQPCRSAYDLTNGSKILRKDEHLLSLKDFNTAQNIGSMIDAGITSFKIEGRLKDLSYVKNITAHYRQILDNYMLENSDCKPASSGHCHFFFSPDPERTYNRGFTDYFLQDRQPMASFSTQKALGKLLGTIAKINRNSLTLSTQEALSPGDGLCFFNRDGQLQGFQVNHVAGNQIQPNRMPDIQLGAKIWRNNDFLFEKALQGRSAERKIPVDLSLSDTPDGFLLSISDEEGLQAQAFLACEKSPAKEPEKAIFQIDKQLSKLGDTAFEIRTLQHALSQPFFIPTSALNDLRRRATDALAEQRILAHRPTDVVTPKNDAPYFEKEIDYRGNVINDLTHQFYLRHGAQPLERGLEATLDYEGKALMTTKYCLRYELRQCLLHKNNKEVSPDYQGTLFLRNNQHLFRLQFNCQRCEMQLFACKEAEV